MTVTRINLDEFIKKSLEKGRIVDPRDKAWIKKPPEYFEGKLNLKFEDACDDLEELKRAFFSLDGNLVFLLSRYKNSPDKNMTVVEMQNEYSAEEIVAVLNAIKESCGLEPDEIVNL